MNEAFGARYRKAWSHPSPRGTKQTQEWRHEKLRRAMQKFESHVYFNEPNKIDGCFAPDNSIVRQAMEKYTQISDGIMRGMWDCWQNGHDRSPNLAALWRNIGELHWVLKLVKGMAANSYDQELGKQFDRCNLEGMMLGTGIASMMGPDEAEAAQEGWGYHHRRYEC